MKEGINFPLVGTIVSDITIQKMILISENEINKIYHTFFSYVAYEGNVLAVDSATNKVTVDTSSDFPDYYKDFTFVSGNNKYKILDWNEDDELTLESVEGIAVGSSYEIINFRIFEEVRDGEPLDFHPTAGNVRFDFLSGRDVGMSDNRLFTKRTTWIRELISLSIDGEKIDNSHFLVYPNDGNFIRINNKGNAPISDFTAGYQGIRFKYLGGFEEMPLIISRLCIVYTAIRVLNSLIAGTYNEFVNIDMPGLSGGKGEHYRNIVEAVNKFQVEARGIVSGESIGTRYRTGSVFMSRVNPTFQPFTYVG